ncbi:MAG: hypothetical protein PHD76_04050 [Methylacidiphilales bacterium]|nr:hypothetical protein [Candidatus Methylacidiphilales bacterium]
MITQKKDTFQKSGYSKARVARGVGLSLYALALLYFTTFAQQVAADVLKKTPDLNEIKRATYPLNLARINLGAHIKSDRPTQATQKIVDDEKDESRSNTGMTLISDDQSISTPLLSGKTSYIISLPQTYPLDFFNFQNYKCAGKFSVFLSKNDLDFNSPDWRPAGQIITFAKDHAYECHFTMADARYVKVTFDVSIPGEIRAFGLFGTAKNYGLRGKPEVVDAQQPVEQIVNYSYSALYTAKSSVAYVSSTGPGNKLSDANYMIDNNISTSYSFAPDDPHPCLILDLSSTTPLRRISGTFTSPPGDLNIYLLYRLPGEDSSDVAGFLPYGSSSGTSGLPIFLAQIRLSAPPSLTIPPAFFDKTKPYRTIEMSGGPRRMAVNFDMTPVRYIMFRFIPKKAIASAWGNGSGFSIRKFAAALLTQEVPIVQLAADSGPSGAPFTASEISAFGNTVTQFYLPETPVPQGLSDAVNNQLGIPPDPPPQIPVTSP